MTLPTASKFEDMSSDIHMLVFEYFNAQQLIEAFFDLNRYFNGLISDHHLLLACWLIREEDDLDLLLSKIQLRQFQSLQCYDYHLFQLNDLTQLTCLRSLIVYKYAKNLPEDLVIDRVLSLPALEQCQIKMSLSQGNADRSLVSWLQDREERGPSNLRVFQIESKYGLPSSYLHSQVLRYLPRLKYLDVNVKFTKRVYPMKLEPIDALLDLSTLIFRMETGKLDFIYLLAQYTPNVQHLELHGTGYKGDPSWINASQWFQLLSAWKFLRSFRVCLTVRRKLLPGHFHLVQNAFRWNPFLAQRRLRPVYSQGRHKKISFHTFFRSS